MGDRHVDIGGKYCDQQQNQSVSSGATTARPEQSHAARNFCRAADRDQRAWPG